MQCAGVTLHVSVWVEIERTIYKIHGEARHAPRERVSWNCRFSMHWILLPVTLHVSVWVEIPDTIDEQVMNFVTLHVSVWVEIQNDVKIGEDL